MPAWTADANALASLATAWARAVNWVRCRFRETKKNTPPTMPRPARTATMMMAIVPPEAPLLLVVVGVLGVVVVVELVVGLVVVAEVVVAAVVGGRVRGTVVGGAVVATEVATEVVAAAAVVPAAVVVVPSPAAGAAPDKVRPTITAATRSGTSLMPRTIVDMVLPAAAFNVVPNAPLLRRPSAFNPAEDCWPKRFCRP
jgi:hypothetical protein